MSSDKYKKKSENDDYNTVDDIDEYLRGVVAANLSRRLPFYGN